MWRKPFQAGFRFSRFFTSSASSALARGEVSGSFDTANVVTFQETTKFLVALAYECHTMGC